NPKPPGRFVWDVRIWEFGFVSDLVLRISDFRAPAWICPRDTADYSDTDDLQGRRMAHECRMVRLAKRCPERAALGDWLQFDIGARHFPSAPAPGSGSDSPSHAGRTANPRGRPARRAPSLHRT